MKRVLVAFLALFALVLGVGIVSAQLDIKSNASITPTNRVYAAWQPFEKGVMIWWSDLDQIWVLVNPTGSNTTVNAYIYEDDWEGTSYAYSPPSGRFAPVRGFGEIWHFIGGSASNNPLGWALSEEIGFDSAARTVITSSSGSTDFLIQGPGDTKYGVRFPAIPNSSNSFIGLGSYWVLDIG